MNSLTLTALTGLPIIQQGDDLAALILEALARASLALEAGDVLVVTSKIVSKADGRFASLADVVPGEEAQRVASLTGKDSRFVELVLRESQTVVRTAHNTLITRHRLGFVSANAGLDHSNLDGSEARVLLLPIDPDASARALRDDLFARTGVQIGVVISDTHGRPHRLGNVGVAVGVAGLPAILDLRGTHDLFGRVLQVTVQGYADMVASAATLISGEGAEGRPVVHVRGLRFPPLDGRASEIIRPAEQDLFR